MPMHYILFIRDTHQLVTRDPVFHQKCPRPEWFDPGTRPASRVCKKSIGDATNSHSQIANRTLLRDQIYCAPCQVIATVSSPMSKIRLNAMGETP